VPIRSPNLNEVRKERDIMAEGKSVKCPWCEKEDVPKVSKEKSDYGDIVVRRCSACEKILASYLDEKAIILESVRTFGN
jgi:hypothetical protein